jgi:DNA polymerase
VLHRIVLAPGADLAGFRGALRTLVRREAAPAEVVWTSGEKRDLFGVDARDEAPPVALPRRVAELIQTVVCHRDPDRHALLYALAWRVLHGERALLEVASDPLVHRLELMARAVRRDIHKMHAFLRFRRVDREDGGEQFVAWFEPDHYILEAVAPFFVDRFRSLDWTILTLIGSLHWNGRCLEHGPPARRSDAPADDAFEAGWRDYYESTFNPARTNPKAMRAEMPKKYWHNMPEAQAITGLIRSAGARVDGMIARAAEPPIKRNPDKAVAAMADGGPKSLVALNAIITASPPLVPGSAKAVLGEGPEGAAIAFVGEQPGDQEDLLGRPFVGPAGQLLDRALAEAGIDRAAAYVTNAVKHFKYVQRGKRRIHQTPTAGEVKHYRWWLPRELELVRPSLVVALGATAALALTGRALPITRARGETSFGAQRGYITVHPSYLLRITDESARLQAHADFLADLRRIREIGTQGSTPRRLAAE